MITDNIETYLDTILREVRETNDAFIFSTLSKFALANYNIVVDKKELCQAIQLIRTIKESGPSIEERWTTATQQNEMLKAAYERGFQDGVDKEHSRISDILKGV